MGSSALKRLSLEKIMMTPLCINLAWAKEQVKLSEMRLAPYRDTVKEAFNQSFDSWTSGLGAYVMPDEMFLQEWSFYHKARKLAKEAKKALKDKEHLAFLTKLWKLDKMRSRDGYTIHHVCYGNKHQIPAVFYIVVVNGIERLRVCVE